MATTKVIDYAWGYKSTLPSLLKSKGVGIVVRYVGTSSSKCLTKTEADQLRAAGIDIACVYESTAGFMLTGGFDNGVTCAKRSLDSIVACGGPAKPFVYFACDVDTANFAAIDAFLKGAASVLGADKVGVYGSYSVCNHCLSVKTAAKVWQTVAWSGGKRLRSAVLYQLLPKAWGDLFAGLDYDPNEMQAEDIGQWGCQAATPGSDIVGMSANTVLDVARKELGVEESPAGSNRQKYGAEFNDNGVAWCAIFVSWVFKHAGDLGLIGGLDDFTVSMAKWFYDRSQWVEPYGDVRPGDVVFFNFGDWNYGKRWKGIHHVGIVEGVQPDGRIVTIEGNTSVSSDDNGGKVMRRVRSRAGIAGFGRPKYGNATPEVTNWFHILVPVEDIEVIEKVKSECAKRWLDCKVLEFGSALLIHASNVKVDPICEYLKTVGLSGYTFDATRDAWKMLKGLYSLLRRAPYYWYLTHLGNEIEMQGLREACDAAGFSYYEFGSTGFIMFHCRDERVPQAIEMLQGRSLGDTDGCKLPTGWTYANSHISRF